MPVIEVGAALEDVAPDEVDEVAVAEAAVLEAAVTYDFEIGTKDN